MNRIGNTLIHTGSNEDFVRALVASEVEFLVIGGLAVAWYCADRQADDMDILINPTSENSVRVSQFLTGLNMSGFSSDSFTRLGLQIPFKQHYYAELLTPQKNGPTYSEIANDAVDAKLFNIPVKLASIASLIRLKEQVIASAEIQKDKHLKDIENLKKYSV